MRNAGLCALWNGQVTVQGDPQSPTFVVVWLGHRRQIPVTWPLATCSSLSSWAGLLQAYEEWILSDEAGVGSAAEALMETLPDDFHHGPMPPAHEFWMLVERADTEREAIHRMSRTGLGPEDRPVDKRELGVADDFWSRALPRALDRRLASSMRSLSDLLNWVDEAGRLGT